MQHQITSICIVRIRAYYLNSQTARCSINKRARTDLYLLLDYQTSFESVQDKKFNIYFKMAAFTIRLILVTFDLQVSILPMKFLVSWPFGSGQKVQKRFSTWLLWRPPWISDQNDFSCFWSISHPDTSYQIKSQSAFLFRKKNQIYWKEKETQGRVFSFLFYHFFTVFTIAIHFYRLSCECEPRVYESLVDELST